MAACTFCAITLRKPLSEAVLHGPRKHGHHGYFASRVSGTGTLPAANKGNADAGKRRVRRTSPEALSKTAIIQ